MHENFRLWLSSAPHPQFPISILQQSIKITTQPPRGIKLNLLRLYKSMNDVIGEENSLSDSDRPCLLDAKPLIATRNFSFHFATSIVFFWSAGNSRHLVGTPLTTSTTPISSFPSKCSLCSLMRFDFLIIINCLLCSTRKHRG